MKQIYLFLWAAIGVVLLSTGCSSTSAIPDGEQLYTGMKPTEYVDADKSEHATSVREELDVVLTTKPNGSLFGSPTLQSPLKIGLWIWNAFSQGTTSFDKWMVKAFGTQPVLMSYANPDLHTTVGRNLLKKRGYFNGDISYSLVPQKNPKKLRKNLLPKKRQKQTPPPTSRRKSSGRHVLCLISSCLQRKLKKRTTPKPASRSSEAARRSVTQATFPKTANARASAAP